MGRPWLEGVKSYSAAHSRFCDAEGEYHVRLSLVFEVLAERDGVLLLGVVGEISKARARRVSVQTVDLGRQLLDHHPKTSLTSDDSPSFSESGPGMEDSY
jgi:hypothetical protein